MARLISLNVERSRHLDRILPLLERLEPDVACLQELVPGDIPAISARTGLRHAHFAQMTVHPSDGLPFGVGILARRPFTTTDLVPYAGGGDGAMLFDRTTEESKLATCRYLAVRATVADEGGPLVVATTHFPWTPDGEARPFQTAAVERLIAGLGGGPLVLTGDFNAPRGGAIFGALARTWSDCIPPHVTTSIDPVLHRAGPLELMVDGLFVTPDYHAADVAMHAGVSDHQAISATIRRAGIGP